MKCDDDATCTKDRNDGTNWFCNVSTGGCEQYPVTRGLPWGVIAGASCAIVVGVAVVIRLVTFVLRVRGSAESAKVSDAKMRQVVRMANVFIVVAALAALAGIGLLVYFSRTAQATVPDCAVAARRVDCLNDETQLCNPSTSGAWKCVKRARPCGSDETMEYVARCPTADGKTGKCVAKCADKSTVHDDACAKCVVRIDDGRCNKVGEDGGFVAEGAYAAGTPQLAVGGSHCERVDLVADKDVGQDEKKRRLDKVCADSGFSYFCGDRCQRQSAVACGDQVASPGFTVAQENPEFVQSCPLLTKRHGSGRSVPCGGDQCADPTFEDFAVACTLDVSGCPSGTAYAADVGKCVGEVPPSAGGDVCPSGARYDADKKTCALSVEPDSRKGCRPPGDKTAYHVDSQNPSGVLCRPEAAVQYAVTMRQTRAATITADRTALRDLEVTLSVEGATDAAQLRACRYWFYVCDVDAAGVPVVPAVLREEGGGNVSLRLEYVEGADSVSVVPGAGEAVVKLSGLRYTAKRSRNEPLFVIPSGPPGQAPGPVLAFRVFFFVADAAGTLLYATKALQHSSIATCTDEATGVVAVAERADSSRPESRLFVESDRRLAQGVVLQSSGNFDMWLNAATFDPERRGSPAATECKDAGCLRSTLVPTSSDVLNYALVPCTRPGACYMMGTTMIAILAFPLPAVADSKDARFYVMREQMKYQGTPGAGRQPVVSSSGENNRLNDGKSDARLRNFVTISDPRPGMGGASVDVFYVASPCEVETTVTFSIGVWDASQGGTEWTDARVRSPLSVVRVDVPGYTPEICAGIRDPSSDSAPFYTVRHGRGAVRRPGDEPQTCVAPGRDGQRSFYCLLRGYHGLQSGAMPASATRIDRLVESWDPAKTPFVAESGEQCQRVERTDYLQELSSDSGNSPLGADKLKALMRFDESGGMGSESQCLRGVPHEARLFCGTTVAKAKGGDQYFKPRYVHPNDLRKVGQDPGDGMVLDPSVVWGSNDRRYLSEVAGAADGAVKFARDYMYGTGYEPELPVGESLFGALKKRLYDCPDPNTDWKEDPKNPGSKAGAQKVMDCDNNKCAPTWTKQTAPSGEPVAYWKSFEWLPVGPDADGLDMNRDCCNASALPGSVWANQGHGEGGRCACGRKDGLEDPARCTLQKQRYRCAITNLYQRTPPLYLDTDLLPSRKSGDTTWEKILTRESVPRYACVVDNAAGKLAAEDCLAGVCNTAVPNDPPGLSGAAPRKTMGRVVTMDSGGGGLRATDMDTEMPLFPPLTNEPGKLCGGGFVPDGIGGCKKGNPCPTCYDQTDLHYSCGARPTNYSNDPYVPLKDACERCDRDMKMSNVVSEGRDGTCAYWAAPNDPHGDIRMAYGPPVTKEFFGDPANRSRKYCYRCMTDSVHTDTSDATVVFEPGTRRFRKAAGDECAGQRDVPLLNCAYLPRSDVPSGKTVMCMGATVDTAKERQSNEHHLFTYVKDDGKGGERLVDEGKTTTVSTREYPRIDCRGIPVSRPE